MPRSHAYMFARGTDPMPRLQRSSPIFDHDSRGSHPGPGISRPRRSQSPEPSAAAVHNGIKRFERMMKKDGRIKKMMSGLS